MMSQAHFSREVKKAYGATPRACLLTRRIEQAMVLLRSGSTVAEACMSVGATSPGSFRQWHERTSPLSGRRPRHGHRRRCRRGLLPRRPGHDPHERRARRVPPVGPLVADAQTGPFLVLSDPGTGRSDEDAHALTRLLTTGTGPGPYIVTATGLGPRSSTFAPPAPTSW